jgi:hypothetical protein
MAVFKRRADFLPEGTKLMVAVNPSGNNKGDVLQHLSRIKINPPSQSFFVPLYLDEPLKIEFRISSAGKLKKELVVCKCHTPVLPNTQLESLNNAYQEISGLLEQGRRSRGGKVYFKIYYQDDKGNWRLIDERRDQVYQPYEAEFQEHLRIINERFNGYVKPLSETQKLFAFEVQQQDELINALQLEKDGLLAQLEQLTQLLEKSKLIAYQRRLEEFKERLELDYPEANGPDSWQEWIYKNNWLFGIQYGDPIGHPKVGFRSILDYLFPTPDGFIDILEIKKPTHDVLKRDQSHPGAFSWSNEANGAIGQVVHYLYEIELHQLEIAQKLRREHALKLSTIKPRAFILVGKSDFWDEEERDAFRKLNHSLHGIEILTYTDLLRRGENLIKVYTD